MAEIKEPEEAVKVIMDALQFLQEVKVKAEWPIPVVRDRQGKLVKDLTLKSWMQKLNEEVDELKGELLSVYALDEDVASEYVMPEENRKFIVGELCDVIEVLYSMANQMGIDGDMIQQGIHETNKKLRERGCI
jgi:predicted HAD superfamily Cof-like phosphohydrolase